MLPRYVSIRAYADFSPLDYFILPARIRYCFRYAVF